MKFFQNVLTFLGIINRYWELQLGNIAFYVVLIKIFTLPGYSDGLLLSLVVLYALASKIIEMHIKRGLWEELEYQRKENETLKSVLFSSVDRINKDIGDLRSDHQQTKNMVTLLNNKQVLTSFSQGLKNKGAPTDIR